MIGNDIVDLSLAAGQSNWQHPRFLEKIFSHSEQQLILESSDRFSTIWRLWTTKEAAYTAYTQSVPGRFFNPKSFICSSLKETFEVTYKDFRIEVKTVLDGNAIYAETISNEQPVTEVLYVPGENLSMLLREALYSKVSETLGIDSAELNLIKDYHGTPKLYHNALELNLEVSLTHHGSYAAYSIVYL